MAGKPTDPCLNILASVRVSYEYKSDTGVEIIEKSLVVRYGEQKMA
jgi:hypothetical protein